MEKYPRPPYVIGDIIGYIATDKNGVRTIEIEKIILVTGYINEENKTDINWFVETENSGTLDLEQIIYKLN